MKILHISTYDLFGGAARAAYRIHRGLLSIGIDTKFLVQKKTSDDPSVIGPETRLQKLHTRIRLKASMQLLKLQKTTNPSKRSFNYFPSGIHKRINAMDADVVHLHWINDEMISVREIARINKPIVWTSHDMWAFSGTDHYEDLEIPGRYYCIYERSNRPSSYRRLDLDRWTWERKKKHWANTNYHMVAPSSWLADCISKSDLLKEQPVRVIHNCLDTDCYKPLDKELACSHFSLSANKKHVMFGALSGTTDKRKGFHLLQSALQQISVHETGKELEIIVFGSDEPPDPPDLGLPTRYLGFMHDDDALALLYSAADVIIVPSTQESFGQNASESLACGTPVVAFGATGLLDIVDHKQNGYLAKPFDPEDLAQGIIWVLEDDTRRQTLGTNARNKAVEKFDITKVAKQYTDLYEHILSGNRPE